MVPSSAAGRGRPEDAAFHESVTPVSRGFREEVCEASAPRSRPPHLRLAVPRSSARPPPASDARSLGLRSECDMITVACNICRGAGINDPNLRMFKDL